MTGALKRGITYFHTNYSFLMSPFSLSLSLPLWCVCVVCGVCVLLIYTICVFIFTVSQQGLSFTESNEPILWLLKVSNF